MTMIDAKKHAEYWKVGAQEDWDAARQLLASDKTRHGLFFVHLALEKVIKGIICLQSGDIPPRLHNLIRLAENAELNLSENQRDILADINQFNLEGRYPDWGGLPPSQKDASDYLQKSEEVFLCLIKRF